MTGTITEVLSIVKIDDKIIGDGKVGSISKQLYDAFGKKIDTL